VSSPLTIPVTLPNAPTVYVEATPTSREEDVAFDPAPFEEFAEALTAIASSVAKSLERVRPKKAVIEFGCEVGIASGKLTAILVKGTAKANFKVSLEWSE
jgi:hypothetical protein